MNKHKNNIENWKKINSEFVNSLDGIFSCFLLVKLGPTGRIYY